MPLSQVSSADSVGKNGPKLKAAKGEEVLGVTRKGFLWIFQKVPIAGLVNFLADSGRQPVVDGTGLMGVYDFTIDLTPTDKESPQSARGGVSTSLDPTMDFGRVSTAVEDQLGLKLESRKITVESLIIGQVERLSEN